MNFPPLTIIITSNEPWGDVWFSKQHYANELALLGYEVYFLNPHREWSPSNLFSFSVTQKTISAKLTVISYKNNFPIRVFPTLFLKLNDLFNSWKIKKATRQKKLVIWWQFDPFRFVNIHFFSNIKRIYHIVDPYQHIWSDKEIEKKADILVSVSNYYLNDYKASKKPYLYIPHGISFSEEKIDPAATVEIHSQYGDYHIIFVGTVTADVDLELLAEFAKELPQYKMLLIGPLALADSEKYLFNELCQLPNVIYSGSVHSSALKNFISLAKVGIVPYKNKLIENKHRTPLKIMNYLAQNLPTVTTINFELQELNDRYIFVAESKAKFIEHIKLLLEGKIQTDRGDLNRFKDKVRYPVLIETILKALFSAA